MKNLITEFKEFFLRGNVIELAVGMLMGTSFTALVTAFTTNIIQPIINKFGGGDQIGFEPIILGVKFEVGAFISAIITFLITAFVTFMIVKGYNKMHELFDKKEAVEEATAGPTTEELLADILKQLKENN